LLITDPLDVGQRYSFPDAFYKRRQRQAQEAKKEAVLIVVILNRSVGMWMRVKDLLVWRL